jgi:glycosyltransferase involved in cell wall biosynthesis
MEGRYHEEKKKNIIISVGRFFVASHSKKQLEMTQFFVNHQDVFKDYEYHLVGSVSNSPKDIEYLNQIKALAATVKNVVIHEDCPSAELMELYTQAKIFWHATGYMVDENRDPDKMEHFGITTVEAMSFGAVPVVINKGGQKETVIPGENGYLWNTEEECVENTVRLIRDDALRRKLAEASVKRAKSFSIDEFYRQNRRIFNAYNL